MNNKKLARYISQWMIPILACAVAVFVLFVPPTPGVADQGDFQRVMTIAGLRETDIVMADSEARFFYFLKTEYEMTPVNPLRLLGILPSSSILYPVFLAKVLCRMLGLKVFNTCVLAVLYAVLYIIALWICLNRAGVREGPASILFSFLSIPVLLDGNYLVWFNSLYGEPMMIIGLLLFVASVLHGIERMPQSFKGMLPLFISACLFLGSKAQCITALPFVVLMAVRLMTGTCARSSEDICLQQNGHTEQNIGILRRRPGEDAFRRKGSAGAGLGFTLPLILLLAYSLGFFVQQNKDCGVDTNFNAVFYGILKNSKDPAGDLEMLGLPADMAAEAGKHAYLPHSAYEKYVPGSELTRKAFNERISNFILVRFYLQNPQRLIAGMEYTASESFQTGTFLGKYRKAEVPEATYRFNRFTAWSDFRSTFFPKKLWFILLVYMSVLAISAMEYVRSVNDHKTRLRIELLWTVMAIGIFQFPMPFVGNGEADTAKQLFLFNFTFDILVLVACKWAFSKLFFSDINA